MASGSEGLQVRRSLCEWRHQVSWHHVSPQQQPPSVSHDSIESLRAEALADYHRAFMRRWTGDERQAQAQNQDLTPICAEKDAMRWKQLLTRESETRE